jgi:hypothetical protein
VTTRDHKKGKLPTVPVTKEQRVVLVESLLVTWKVLDHLKAKGMLKPQPETRAMVRAEDSCCKRDGGTCCVNWKRPFAE